MPIALAAVLIALVAGGGMKTMQYFHDRDTAAQTIRTTQIAQPTQPTQAQIEGTTK